MNSGFKNYLDEDLLLATQNLDLISYKGRIFF